jgi:hypothetical protein
MSRSSLTAGAASTRLVRLLSEFAVPAIGPGPDGFAEAMEDLIGFGESMKLAMLHEELAGMAHVAGPEPMSFEALKHDLLDVRLGLMRRVLDSFDSDDASTRPKLPRPGTEVPDEALLTFEPYHRFYAAHQREFDARIHRLQLRVREALTGRSAALARLVVLDETLRELVAAHTRKSLVVIPVLLGKRFDAMLQAHQAQERGRDAGGADVRSDDTGLHIAAGDGAWLRLFCREMQDVLLAELDLRLMPVVGLVEAVEEEVTRK